MAVYDCDNLRLSGLTHINSPKSHMHIVRCNHASISQLNILAPEDSPNTDGIDVAYSTDVKIQNCSIATGSAIPVYINSVWFVEDCREGVPRWLISIGMRLLGKPKAKS